MNPNLNPENQDRLLEVVLRDEDWQITSAAGKAQAVAAMRTSQYRRRALRRAGGAAALAAALSCAALWFGRTRPSLPPLAQKRAEPPAAAKPGRYLTDDELLASFPQGSCFLFEVDGRKELVFLDPEVERQYVGRP
jgi:hypothetical protein